MKFKNKKSDRKYRKMKKAKNQAVQMTIGGNLNFYNFNVKI